MLMLALSLGTLRGRSGGGGSARERPLVDRKIDDDRDHRYPDRDQPHGLARAGVVEYVPAEPAAEEAPELVEEEHEAGQHGEMPDPEDSRDDPVGKRHRAEPEKAHRRREQIRRKRRERKSDQQRDRDPAQRVDRREQIGLGEPPAQLPREVRAEDVEQADERERDGAVARRQPLVDRVGGEMRPDEDDLEATREIANAEQPEAPAAEGLRDRLPQRDAARTGRGGI